MHNRKVDGFTLLELLVTLAVAAILLGIAVPSYRSIVQRNSLAANVNDLVGDLNFARSEAVTRGQTSYMCNSTDGSTCLSTADWSRGWIVYIAKDPAVQNPGVAARQILRVHQASGSGYSVATTATDPLTFSAGGFALTSNRTYTLSTVDSKTVTRVTVGSTGRVDTQDAAQS